MKVMKPIEVANYIHLILRVFPSTSPRPSPSAPSSVDMLSVCFKKMRGDAHKQTRVVLIPTKFT